MASFTPLEARMALSRCGRIAKARLACGEHKNSLGNCLDRDTIGVRVFFAKITDICLHGDVASDVIWAWHSLDSV